MRARLLLARKECKPGMSLSPICRVEMSGGHDCSHASWSLSCPAAVEGGLHEPVEQLPKQSPKQQAVLAAQALAGTLHESGMSLDCKCGGEGQGELHYSHARLLRGGARASCGRLHEPAGSCFKSCSPGMFIEDGCQRTNQMLLVSASPSGWLATRNSWL